MKFFVQFKIRRRIIWNLCRKSETFHHSVQKIRNFSSFSAENQKFFIIQCRKSETFHHPVQKIRNFPQNYVKQTGTTAMLIFFMPAEYGQLSKVNICSERKFWLLAAL